MKSSWIVVLSGFLLSAVVCAVDLELTVTRKVTLKGELEDRVTFGLLKEMTCDSEGNIYSPSNRKYGSAINAIVRFPHDATSFTAFSIDSRAGLDGSTITDFDLESGGGLFLLAREVLKYSETTVPVAFGKSYLLHYDKNGTILSRLELRLDSKDFEPSGITMLQGGEVLVVGKQLKDGRNYLIAEILMRDGNLKTRYALNPDGRKTSKTDTVASTRVFNPEAIRGNGLIYVLRGTTTEPVYVLSEDGHLVKTIVLKPADIEFDSPKILGNGLIVSEHPSASGHLRRDFPVFSLETGEIEDRYFWYRNTAGLACAAPHSLTFIGQDISGSDSGWAIFEASPGSAKPKASATGR